MGRSAAVALLLTVGLTGSALAQVTGLPTFDAPYRAFVKHEFGGTVSFPSGNATGLEGQYRFGYQTFDVGFRGGVLLPSGGLDNVFLLGVSARDRVLTHTEDFPLDGALVVGLGAQLVSGANAVIIPAGLSLGRRFDIKNSPVSVVPYAEPVAFVVSGRGTTDLNFSVGLGGDFRLSKAFDARVGVGLGDIQGVSVSAIWVH
jgi:hypothetical protein